MFMKRFLPLPFFVALDLIVALLWGE